MFVAAVVMCVSAAAWAEEAKPMLKAPVGLQLYSLRTQFQAEGVPKTLDRVKEMGFKYVELAGTYNLPAGVNLQLNTNLIAPRTIGLRGGTIEGFLWIDHPAPAAQRIRRVNSGPCPRVAVLRGARP